MRSWFAPGDQICPAKSHCCGSGTYERDGWICSQLLGYSTYESPTEGLAKVSVRSSKESASITPAAGKIVKCQITHVGTRTAKCVIVELEDRTLRSPFVGEIRREDVLRCDADKVAMCDMFRAGDRVRARVLHASSEQPSGANARVYYLTTAENELGVLECTNESSHELMVPISWCEFQCPRTLLKEKRKVAKPTSDAADRA